MNTEQGELDFYECQTCKLEGYSTISGKAKIIPVNGVVTYKIMNSTGDLTHEALTREIEKWFDLLDNHFDFLRHEETDSNDAQIKIFFGQESAPFPFGKTSLAYVPNKWRNQHNIYVNDVWDWKRTYQIKFVIFHELGHSYGQWHNEREPISFMYPTYQIDGIMTNDDRNFYLHRYATEIRAFEKKQEKKTKISDVIEANKDQFARLNERTIDLVLTYFDIPHEKSQRKTYKVLLFCNFLRSQHWL